MWVWPLDSPSMSAFITQQFKINAAPITENEAKANRQIYIESAQYSKQARDIVEGSVYSRDATIPTAIQKVWRIINEKV